MSQQRLTKGSLPMFKLTLPLAMEQFFRILVSSIDTMMLSGYSEKAVAGVGLMGQYVYIYPDKNIVVVRTGVSYDTFDWIEFIEKVTSYL